MAAKISLGWMKLGLRAQICPQCHPNGSGDREMRSAPEDAPDLLAPYSCQSRCSLFIQLPRLAKFLERHRAKPPAGYEEFAIQLLAESPAGHSDDQGLRPALDYSTEALAILERIAGLFVAAVPDNPSHECARKAMAEGQMSVQI